jgi:hypothetical protein
MAEPLTSSDLLRERMGFGVSPLASPETRRSYAAAGLSPLGTQDRERIAAGAGISPMAGPIETDAWKMTQYMTGQREQAPVSYGGIGERPRGESRRAIRMQDEWDKQRERQLKEQQAIRSMEAMDFEQNLKLRNQELQEEQVGWRREAEWSRQNVEHRTNQHVTGFLRGIRGGYDEMGNTIPELDPESPDYEVRRKELLRNYPLAAKHPEIEPILGAMDEIYQTRQAAEEDRIKEDRQEQKVSETFRIQQEATAAKLGINTDEFIDPETGDVNRVGLMRRIGEAQREELDSKEERVKQAKLDEETKREAGQLTKDMRDIRDDIELKTMQASRMKGSVKEAAIIEIDALNDRYERRSNEFDKLTLPKLTKEDKESYDELPEGAEFFLDGRKVRKPKSQQADSASPSAAPQPTPEPEDVTPQESPAPAPPRPAPTPETVAPEAMLQDMNQEQQLSAELDSLYKQGYKFSPDKAKREQYANLSQQLKATRKSKNKEKYSTISEIRKRMNEIGPFNSDPKLRDEYSRLKEEREVLLGA